MAMMAPVTTRCWYILHVARTRGGERGKQRVESQIHLSMRMNGDGGHAPSDHLLERARRAVDGGICAL